jgi:TolB protein
MNSDGSERRCLTNSPGCDYNAIFSPDGKKIYFLRAASYGKYSPIAMPNWHDIDIYSINIDGSDLKRLTSNHYYGIGNLSIHPDGNTLMARIVAYKGKYSAWMIPVNSPADAMPVQPNLDEYKTLFKSIDYNDILDPLYSPDGTSLLFTWAGHIYVMDLKTNKAQRVTKSDRVIYYYPRFSMDGKHIIFSATIYIDPGFFSPWREEPALWIINKDGTGLEYINISNTHADQAVKLEPPARSYSSPPMYRH